MNSIFNNKKNIARSDALAAKDSPIYQNYNEIKMNLDFSSIDTKNKVFAITSSIPGEGKSSTCVNLGQVYANNDNKVLIIDLDLRRPSLHYFFKIANEKGITDYCINEDFSLDNILIHTSIENLDIITAGCRTPFPSKVLDSKKLNSLIKKLREEYDIILIDTPPVLAASDMVSISEFIDQYVVVCYYGKTRKNDFDETIKRLEKSQVSIAGVVLTHVKSKKQSKDYYTSYYGYERNK